MIQNTTIDERVTLLELQMMEVQEDMVEVQEEVMQLEDQTAFLSDEVVILGDTQVLQDQRIYDLEQETSGKVSYTQVYNLYFMAERVMLCSSSDLDDRVEILEENGGAGGNVTALEKRVTVLEVTATNHEERLITAEADIEGI